MFIICSHDPLNRLNVQSVLNGPSVAMVRGSQMTVDTAGRVDLSYDMMVPANGLKAPANDMTVDVHH